MLPKTYYSKTSKQYESSSITAFYSCLFLVIFLIIISFKNLINAII
jgi:hypothetical protein